MEILSDPGFVKAMCIAIAIILNRIKICRKIVFASGVVGAPLSEMPGELFASWSDCGWATLIVLKGLPCCFRVPGLPA